MRSGGSSTRASRIAPRLPRSRGVTILTPTSFLRGVGSLASILPVTIALETAAEESDPGSNGQIEIVLADGDRILVWSDVETAALMRVLKALSRR
jgi:hypothetical protein